MKSLITESSSHYQALESMSTLDLLANINREDERVAKAVKDCIPVIGQLVDAIYERFVKGGRLIYIGAGTSGRLGILDASEIPPTYGMPRDRVLGLIAGGDQAIRNSVESAEDSFEQAHQDLAQLDLNENDSLIGIAASGTTPYVIGGLQYAKTKNALRGCITNNPATPLAAEADFPIEVIVGPEFVTGSTRMKSGTAQKMVLNMISTSLMIKFGRVKGNKMVNMQLNNNKLLDRGIRFIVEELDISSAKANELLQQYGSVKEVLENYSPDLKR